MSNRIRELREKRGMNQEALAGFIGVSQQTISKVERNTDALGVDLLIEISDFFSVTTDYLLGLSDEKRNVFLAKNGYLVTAFDAAQTGIDKARSLAKRHGVQIDFFQADVLDYRPDTSFDIVFSSGVLHYIPRKLRGEVISSLKEHTTAGGIHAVNVFVDKPFIDPAPDREPIEVERGSWRSGELQGLYHDWLFHAGDEIIFDCDSGGVPHQHCMDILIAEKMDVKPGRV